MKLADPAFFLIVLSILFIYVKDFLYVREDLKVYGNEFRRFFFWETVCSDMDTCLSQVFCYSINLLFFRLMKQNKKSSLLNQFQRRDSLVCLFLFQEFFSRYDVSF